MPIEWDDEKLGTGLPDIDEQHKEWIRRYNEFDVAVVNGQGPATIFNTLAFLVQYTETHFSHEEDRMETCGCPAQSENLRAHNHFRAHLDEMLSWLEQAKPTSVEVVVLKQELEDWLTNHISTIDIQLRGCK
jgi:hemerythrin-like metal-binding protein